MLWLPTQLLTLSEVMRTVVDLSVCVCVCIKPILTSLLVTAVTLNTDASCKLVNDSQKYDFLYQKFCKVSVNVLVAG
jgi:hypothetical protein